MNKDMKEFPNRKKEFFLEISRFGIKDHIDSFLIYLISPVITGIKPSSTITVNVDQEERLIAIYDEKLFDMDFSFIKLRSCSKKSLFFVYNQKSLEKYLKFDGCREILDKEGYGGLSLSEMLIRIKKRIKNDNFPHEIGLFLGIPACDVEGFLNCKECICRGYWKVYDRPEIASELFRLYDMSRKKVVDNTLNGISLNSTISSISNKYINNIDMLQ